MSRADVGPAGREVPVVAALALGFGLVNIDRFLIVTLYPVISCDLSLGLGAVVAITGALLISWGCVSLFFGNLADRVGTRSVMIVSLIAFSLLIGITALATRSSEMAFDKLVVHADCSRNLPEGRLIGSGVVAQASHPKVGLSFIREHRAIETLGRVRLQRPSLQEGERSRMTAVTTDGRSPLGGIDSTIRVG